MALDADDQFVDTASFIAIAFGGIIPNDELRTVFIHAWLVKVAYETLATPLTYWVMGFLKRVDESEVYDVDTGFNLFAFRS